MVSELKAEDIFSVTDPKQIGADRINQVSSVPPLQPLPQGGKELPHGNADAGNDSSNVDDAVRTLNDHAQQLRRELQFSVDKHSGRTIITVLDKETRQVIRQIPPEEAINFARRLNDGADLEIVDTYI
jgi:flagellar protein FlaG